MGAPASRADRILANVLTSTSRPPARPGRPFGPCTADRSPCLPPRSPLTERFREAASRHRRTASRTWSRTGELQSSGHSRQSGSAPRAPLGEELGCPSAGLLIPASTRTTVRADCRSHPSQRLEAAHCLQTAVRWRFAGFNSAPRVKQIVHTPGFPRALAPPLPPQLPVPRQWPRWARGSRRHVGSCSVDARDARGVYHGRPRRQPQRRSRPAAIRVGGG
jgi:hypothetical protein